MGSQEVIEVIESEQEENNSNWYNVSELSLLKEGFDLERFVDHPRKDFHCPICLGVVRNPLECSQCGILLCKKCAYSCVKHQSTFFTLTSSSSKFNCPICRGRQPPREPSQILKNIISALQVFCKNKSHGCLHSCSLGELKSHQKDCEFKAIRCANHHFCKKEGNKGDFLSVEFPRVGKSNLPGKSKLVCSEVCRKVVFMDYYLRTEQTEKAISEYKKELDAWISLKK
jgi:hypothetical protein